MRNPSSQTFLVAALFKRSLGAVSHAWLACPLFAALLLAACNSSTSPQGPGPAGAFPLDQTGSYLVRGDTLIRTRDARPSPYCLDGLPQTRTQPGYSDTALFSLKGDTLFLEGPPEAFSLLVDTGYLDAVGSYIELHLRMEKGTGPEGRWRKLGRRFKFISDNWPDDRKQGYRDFEEIEKVYAEFDRWEWKLSGGKLRYGWKTDLTGYEVAIWEGRTDPGGLRLLDSYEMQVRALDTLRVEYRGLKTGETVIVKFRGPKWWEYSSDNPAHPPYGSGGDGITCLPPVVEKAWMAEFLDANMKGINQ